MIEVVDSAMAEESVIACILSDAQNVLPTVRKILQPGDFVEANARAIFRAAVELDDNRLPIDPVTLQERAAQNGNPVSTVWIKQTMAAFLTTASIAANAEAVHRAAIDREARDVGEMLMRGVIIPEEAAERLQDVLTGRRSTLPTPSEDAAEFYTRLCRARSGEIRTTLPTGFRDLDNILGGGLAEGGLTTIAARSSVGKSTVALAIADNVARAGGRVLYFSLEMPKHQLWSRRLASRTGMDSTRIASGTFPDTEETWQAIKRGVSELAEENLLIWDKPCRIGEIELKMRAAAPLDLVVIDYLTNITDEPGERGNPYVSASNAVRRLQALASATGVPVLLVSQLNRASDSRDNKRPRLSDLRDTGKIEEVSDAVLLLYRDSYYEETRPNPWEPETMELDVAKNRHGMTGRVYLEYTPMCTTVRSAGDGIRDTDEPTPFERG